MPTSEQIRVGGIWLPSVGPFGDLTWSTNADGGSEQASWSMDLPPNFLHPVLVGGSLVEILAGSHVLWSGSLAEPEDDENGWKMNAAGLHADAAGYLCLDGSGNTASEPDLVIDEAIERGLRWTRPESISTADFAVTGDTDMVNTLKDLLDAWAQSESKRWRVDGLGRVYAVTTPTEPTWHLIPGSGRVGRADDEYASDIYVRYRSGASTYATVHVGDSLASSRHRFEAPLDATNLGVITSGKATDVGEGALARGRARFAWTKAVELSKFQITTPGGTPADLRLVRGGQVARLHGVINEQGIPLAHVDFEIGRTSYDSGAKSIQIAPTELAARTLRDVLQAALAS